VAVLSVEEVDVFEVGGVEGTGLEEAKLEGVEGVVPVVTVPLLGVAGVDVVLDLVGVKLEEVGVDEVELDADPEAEREAELIVFDFSVFA